MELTIKYNDFINKFDELLSNGKELYNQKQLANEDNFNEIKQKIKDWEKIVYNFLNDSFYPEKNQFAIEFYNSKRIRYFITNQQKTFQKLKDELFEDFDEKINTLIYFKKIFLVSDIVIKSESIILRKRKTFSTEEILELILEKLYKLYDDNYYSIDLILLANDIKLDRRNEERELAKILENKGLVELLYTNSIYLRLTTQGKIFVENKKKVHSANYNNISKSKEEIYNKIDKIIEQLTKLGFGQEILFNELEELKDLYGKIDNKNWGQLLKGKLIDLGLSQIINKDAVIYIYKELTEQILYLL